MDKNLKETTQSPQIDANRRRLTKAGLAAPAVLGILASRSVLAEVPWKCTISGQISGNMSGHESETCDPLITRSQTSLAGDYKPPDHTKKITDVFPDDQVITKDYIFINGDGVDLNNVTLTTNDTGTGATMRQMLALTASTTDLKYAQRALVMLLNAKGYTDTSQLPLTEFQAKKLFVAAATQSSFSDTNPNLTWSYADVTSYIDLFFIDPL